MDKQFILSEIKRAAAANGGASPGIGGFLKQTGIKDSDWKGIYWARWSDAVKEAGLAPNKLTQPYDEKFLFDKYVGLIRKLGHFPAKAELQLESRSDKDFPNQHTFLKRLGPKRSHPQWMVRYCQDRPEYSDVVAICAAELGDIDYPLEASTPTTGDGFVYLLKMGKSYKLGRSNDFARRLREMKIQLPEQEEIIHVIRTDDPPGIETYWHNRFQSKRQRGEWFELDSADIRAFRRRKFM